MSKFYSKAVLDRLAEEHYSCIVVFHDNTVYAGTLSNKIGFSPYYLMPFSINHSGVGFKRSHVKSIILFNGLIYPKEEDGKHKILDIIELNDLINKAGYEFI